MPHESTSDHDPDDSETDHFVEIDPSGRYGRVSISYIYFIIIIIMVFLSVANL